MRKIQNNIVLVAVLVLTMGFISYANEQEHGKENKKQAMGMMGSGGMMGEVMQSMMSRAMCKDYKACVGCKEIHMFLKYADKLGLTEEQISKIKKIKMDAKKEQIRKRADADILKIEKNESLMVDKINLKEVKEKIRKIAELEADNEFICIEACVNSENVLTDDQKKIVETMKKSRMGEMMEQDMTKGDVMSGEEGKKKMQMMDK